MTLTKVVLDTNVIVSAHLQGSGLPAFCFGPGPCIEDSNAVAEESWY
jgi:hypothetical protein